MTADDQLNLIKVRDIHVPITPLLVEALEESGHVKWALDAPHPRLQPCCHLMFEIREFYSTTEFGIFGLHTTAFVLLQRMSDRSNLHAQRITFTYTFQGVTDERVGSLRLLDHYYQVAADEIRGVVHQYLNSR